MFILIFVNFLVVSGSHLSNDRKLLESINTNNSTINVELNLGRNPLEENSSSFKELIESMKMELAKFRNESKNQWEQMNHAINEARSQLELLLNSTDQGGVISNGNWSTWSHWSGCTATCGGGSKFRNRTCSDALKLVSKKCPGEAVEFQSCNSEVCPSGQRLIVYYVTTKIHVNKSNPLIENGGEWGDFSFVRCQLPSITPGWKSFEEVRSVFEEIFKGEKIVAINQMRGETDSGDVVAEVTSSETDEVVRGNSNERELCDINGRPYLYNDVGRPSMLRYPEGYQIFISGGQRRIHLSLSTD